MPPQRSWKQKLPFGDSNLPLGYAATAMLLCNYAIIMPQAKPKRVDLQDGLMALDQNQNKLC